MKNFLIIISILISSTLGQLYPPNGFFPINDLSSLTWAKGINSQQLLKEVLANSSIKMIEADVCKGRARFNGSETPYDIAIMAEPPAITSDLSFQQFLDTIIDFNWGKPVDQRKGIKLDFKDYFAVAVAVPLMSRRNTSSNGTDLQFPVWLNAQVIVRPEEASTSEGSFTEEPSTTTEKPKNIITLDQMITIHKKYLPNSVLSLWWPSKTGQTSYTRQDVDDMITALKTEIPDPLEFEDLPITFNLKAKLAANSLGNIMYLLNTTSFRSTVTLNAEQNDSPTMLSDFLKVVKNKAFVDVPYEFRDNSAGNLGFNLMFVVLSCSLRYFLCSMVN